ncbi:MAG: DUF4421 family protein [Flavobacteriales bacterium]|jgi:hypothetical protein|nr:DUF4421 family protein [Flavobacteriales bacterium]
MTARSLILLAAVLPALHAHGQLGDRVRTLLNGDSLAPPDHDTAYVTTYRSNLTVSLVSRYQFVDVDLERDGASTLTYTTNGNEMYGVGINYKWLSAEALFNVPVLNDSDPAYGRTDSRGFGLGYTGRRLWLRGFWNTTEGFFMDRPEDWIDGWRPGDAPITRPDLANTTWLLSANYALSGKRRYSHNAALFQMERQKRSAGTFVAGAMGWVNDVHADSSLVRPALQDTFDLATGFTRVERTIAGLTLGYTHTFVFGHNAFVHLGLMPGVAYVHQRITTTDAGPVQGEGTAAVVELKLGLGYNGDKWYFAITTGYFYSSAYIAETLSLATNHGTVRLALGLRFGGPRSGLLRKVGL